MTEEHCEGIEKGNWSCAVAIEQEAIQIGKLMAAPAGCVTHRQQQESRDECALFSGDLET